MDDVTKTDKMLRRKDGRVGYVIFNNPERHNAVSLDMWAQTSRILDDYAKDDDVRVVVLTGTDLYRDVAKHFEARQSLGLATRLAVLQEEGLRELSPYLRQKTRVVYQSSDVKLRHAPERSRFRVRLGQ